MQKNFTTIVAAASLAIFTPHADALSLDLELSTAEKLDDPSLVNEGLGLDGTAVKAFYD